MAIYQSQAMPSASEPWNRATDGASVTGDVISTAVEYAFAGTEAVNDEIELCTINDGFRPLGGKIFCDGDVSVILSLRTIDPDGTVIDLPLGGAVSSAGADADVVISDGLFAMKTVAPATLIAKLTATTSINDATLAVALMGSVLS